MKKYNILLVSLLFCISGYSQKFLSYRYISEYDTIQGWSILKNEYNSFIFHNNGTVTHNNNDSIWYMYSKISKVWAVINDTAIYEYSKYLYKADTIIIIIDEEWAIQINYPTGSAIRFKEYKPNKER